MPAWSKYYLINGKLSDGIDRNSSLTDWFYPSVEIDWRSSGTRIPYFERQFSRLLLLAECLGYQIHGIREAAVFHETLTNLIQKNRLFKGVLIRILIKPSGLDHTLADSLILTSDYPDDNYKLNEHGLLIALASPPDHPGFCNLLQSQSNGFRFHRWKTLAQQFEADEVFFTDDKAYLLESPFARIYLVKGQNVFTPEHPSLIKWGIDEIIAKSLWARKMNLSKNPSLLAEHLNQAEEVFLADDLRGIQWVKGFGDKRYFKKYSPQILRDVNQYWLESS